MSPPKSYDGLFEDCFHINEYSSGERRWKMKLDSESCFTPLVSRFLLGGHCILLSHYDFSLQTRRSTSTQYENWLCACSLELASRSRTRSGPPHWSENSLIAITSRSAEFFRGSVCPSLSFSSDDISFKSRKEAERHSSQFWACYSPSCRDRVSIKQHEITKGER